MTYPLKQLSEASALTNQKIYSKMLWTLPHILSNAFNFLPFPHFLTTLLGNTSINPKFLSRLVRDISLIHDDREIIFGIRHGGLARGIHNIAKVSHKEKCHKKWKKSKRGERVQRQKKQSKIKI